MDLNKIHSVYFLGIGGIGMSALARYFSENGKLVGGYDRTSTPLTDELSKQGMQIHFEESVENIPAQFLNQETTLVIVTPAVPSNNAELIFFSKSKFTMLKRAEVLGLIFNDKKGIAIAGTHGKTSVSTFTSYLLSAGGIEISSFLGGISKNFNSNLLIGNSKYVVAEADEFDRSFLQLSPYIALVTTVDADHLDIYANYTDIQNTFSEFVAKTHPEGTIILHQDVDLAIDPKYKILRYSLDNTKSDVYASELAITNGEYYFTLNTPNGSFPGMRVKVPGKVNIENSLAAIAVCYAMGVSENTVKEILPSMQGVVRRFDLQVNTKNVTFFDDYAHHPSELNAAIDSIKELFPGRKLTGIFQPHLYTRTRDFFDGFVKSLSKLDQLILLDIYPAREKPISGVTSRALFDKIDMVNKYHCSKENLLIKLKELNIEVLLTLGAGDINQFVKPIKEYLEQIEED